MRVIFKLLSCVSFIVLICILTFIFSCSKNNDQKVLAKIGTHEITVNQFLESFESQPMPGANQDRTNQKLQHLNHLIENKLLAIYGDLHHYDEDPRIMNQLKAVTKDILIKQLYKTVVADKIDVSEEELRNGFVKLHSKIRARHLFVKSKAEADSLRDLLNHGFTFQQLAKGIFKDSTLAANGGDLGYFSFGDMDENFEKEAYKLKVDEISSPVKTKWGYHIIKVEDRINKPIITESEFNRQRENIKEIIYQRKENRLANEYVKNFMSSKNVVAKANTINFLVKMANKIEKQDQKLLPDENPDLLDNEVNEIKNEMDAHRNDVIVEFEGGDWTLDMFFEKMMETLPQDRPRLTSHIDIAEKIAIMVRNDFLAKEAMNLDLYQETWAKNEISRQTERLVSNLVRYDIVKSVQMNDEDVNAYYNSHIENYRNPLRVKLREIVVSSEEQASNIRKAILAGADFGKLAGEYSIRELSAENKGELGYINIDEYPKIAEPIAKLQNGAISQPVFIDSTYRIFQVLDRIKPEILAFADVKDIVKKDCWDDKLQQKFDLILEPIKLENRVYIDYNLLDKLDLGSKKRVEILPISQ